MKTPPWLAAGVVACGLGLGPGPAWPQSPPAAATSAAPSTLAAALDIAWQRAVDAREADARRRHAEAEQTAAGAWWAASPSLELSHSDTRGGGRAGGRETEIGIGVPLWLPGQRAARSSVAEAAVAQADAAARSARLRLAGELREAVWAVAAQKAELAHAEAVTMAHRQLADDVERRVRAGDLARADALVAQAEHLSATTQRAESLQRLQDARTRWRLLTGLADVPNHFGVLPADEAGAPLDAAHPDWALARLNTALAQRQVELLRRSRRDAPELMLGWRQELAGDEPGRHSVVIGLRLPFATDDRNRPAEVAALGALDVAETAERRLHEQLEAALAAAREALRAALAQTGTEIARAGLLRDRARLVDKSFRAGETPLPDLLRALAAADEAERAVAHQHAVLGLAHARLQQALGRLP